MPKRTLEYDVNGLSIRDIIRLDPIHIKSLKTESLAKLTSRLVSAFNKRAKRLEKSEYAELSPAFRGLQEQGKTRLSVKGLNRRQLKTVFTDAKRLLDEYKTFSIAGTKRYMTQVAERLNYEFKSKEEARQFWEAIDKLKEKEIGTKKTGKFSSADIQREVASLMFEESLSLDDILARYKVIAESTTPNEVEQTANLFPEQEEYDEESEL